MGSYSVLCFVIHIILAASAVVVVAQDFGSDFGSADGSSFDADTSVLSLSGSGTTNPSKLLWRVFNTIEDQAGSPIRVTYRAVGSGTGIKEFVGDAGSAFAPYSDFGSADIPLPFPSLCFPSPPLPVPSTPELLPSPPALPLVHRRARSWRRSARGRHPELGTPPPPPLFFPLFQQTFPEPADASSNAPLLLPSHSPPPPPFRAGRSLPDLARSRRRSSTSPGSEPSRRLHRRPQPGRPGAPQRPHHLVRPPPPPLPLPPVHVTASLLALPDNQRLRSSSPTHMTC